MPQPSRPKAHPEKPKGPSSGRSTALRERMRWLILMSLQQHGPMAYRQVKQRLWEDPEVQEHFKDRPGNFATSFTKDVQALNAQDLKAIGKLELGHDDQGHKVTWLWPRWPLPLLVLDPQLRSSDEVPPQVHKAIAKDLDARTEAPLQALAFKMGLSELLGQQEGAAHSPGARLLEALRRQALRQGIALQEGAAQRRYLLPCPQPPLGAEGERVAQAVHQAVDAIQPIHLRVWPGNHPGRDRHLMALNPWLPLQMLTHNGVPHVLLAKQAQGECLLHALPLHRIQSVGRQAPSRPEQAPPPCPDAPPDAPPIPPTPTPPAAKAGVWAACLESPWLPAPEALPAYRHQCLERFKALSRGTWGLDASAPLTHWPPRPTRWATVWLFATGGAQVTLGHHLGLPEEHLVGTAPGVDEAGRKGLWFQCWALPGHHFERWLRSWGEELQAHRKKPSGVGMPQARPSQAPPLPKILIKAPERQGLQGI